MTDLAQAIMGQAPQVPQSPTVNAQQPFRQQPVGPATGGAMMQQQYAQLYNEWVETLNAVSNDPDALTGLFVMMNHAAQPKGALSDAAHLSNAAMAGRQQMAREQQIKQQLIERKRQMIEGQMKALVDRQQAQAGTDRAQAALQTSAEMGRRTPSVIDVNKANAERARALARTAGVSPRTIGANESLIRSLAEGSFGRDKSKSMSEWFEYWTDRILLEQKGKSREQVWTEMLEPMLWEIALMDEKNKGAAWVAQKRQEYFAADTNTGPSGVDDGGYTPGQVYQGYRYNGGGYQDKNNWTKAE